jgi:hypothetical protein
MEKHSWVFGYKAELITLSLLTVAWTRKEPKLLFGARFQKNEANRRDAGLFDFHPWECIDGAYTKSSA